LFVALLSSSDSLAEEEMERGGGECWGMGTKETFPLYLFFLSSILHGLGSTKQASVEERVLACPYKEY